jgi:hypothetical protein
VGEGGSGWSGGQRLRVSLAWAHNAHPNVWVNPLPATYLYASQQPLHSWTSVYPLPVVPLHCRAFNAGDLTPVGEGGSGLSGGQRLRVSLARALYQPDTRLYLFDDILASLDSHVSQVWVGGGAVVGRGVQLCACVLRREGVAWPGVRNAGNMGDERGN